MTYSPHTREDRARMLRSVGVASIDDLFRVVPEAVRFPTLQLPPPLSELEAMQALQELSDRDQDLRHHPCFLGAGAYYHFIPSVVHHLTGRSEFYTAYTPYQPEISQGTLQATFEYQTMIANLLDLDVANASMYDGATATAEAALVAANITGRSRLLLSRWVNPDYREVLRTYVEGDGIDLLELDDAALTSALDDSVAAVIVQQPSFTGTILDLTALADRAHAVGALLVTAVYPIALGMLRPPGACGADIATGEGQPLGNPIAFGGPYLGLLACRQEYVRHLPGRLVGMTADTRGQRGFVLTLQTREQHIRRERATSNICTNQALNALAATVYLAAMGPTGLRQVAHLCYDKAHYLHDRLLEVPGYLPAGTGPFFNEFVTRCPRPPAEVNAYLLEQGIIGGYDLGTDYEELSGCMLWCATEMLPRRDLDRLVEALRQLG